MKTTTRTKLYLTTLTLLGALILVPIAIYGFSYYATELSQRFFHDKYDLLKPSGTIGHGLGIAGTLMITIGVVTYIIRKRVRRFMQMGALKYWLYFHIFMCTVGPILILMHSTLKFGGIASISFWSMVIVVGSGVIGRVIYLQIPRTIHGDEVSANQLRIEYDRITNSIQSTASIPQSVLNNINDLPSSNYFKNMSISNLIPGIIKTNFTNKRLLREIKSTLKSKDVPKGSIRQIISLCKSQITLSRRIGLLTTMNKLFKYWHIAHLPFAIIMLVTVILHITVAILMGYSWIGH